MLGSLTRFSAGEQPIKMLVDPRAGARLTVGEALTNLVFAAVSDIRDVKCSGNWMWPAKLPGNFPFNPSFTSISNVQNFFGRTYTGVFWGF